MGDLENRLGACSGEVTEGNNRVSRFVEELSEWNAGEPECAIVSVRMGRDLSYDNKGPSLPELPPSDRVLLRARSQ